MAAETLDIDIDWELPQAQRLLQKRDHYTQSAIQKEFQQFPLKDAVEFDPQEHRYATPVADRRFIVVWQRVNVGNRERASVQAVVPAQLISREPEEVKKQLLEVVKLESKGKATL